MDASKWDRAKETISKEYGMSVEPEHGEQSKSGFTLAWAYDALARTLEIQCRDKPFVIPCSVVNKRINALAEGCGIEPAG